LAATVALASARAVATSNASGSPETTIANEIAATAPLSSFETYLDRLMGAESGGRSDAANPRSTALGAFQFIKSTFLEVTRRHFSAEVAGLDEQRILRLRTDREFARRAAAAFSKDNIVYLNEKGLEPTFAHLRLAFLLGPADAARLLQAHPQTRVVEILSAPVIRAKPFMGRMSATDLLEKSVRDVTPDPIIAVSPRPQLRSAARVRPTTRDGLGAGIAIRKESCNQKLASCHRFIALQKSSKKQTLRRAGQKI
jgi:hypothetical protein